MRHICNILSEICWMLVPFDDVFMVPAQWLAFAPARYRAAQYSWSQTVRYGWALSSGSFADDVLDWESYQRCK